MARFKVPITVGDPHENTHFAVIRYNEPLGAFMSIFYQKDTGGSHIIRNVTSKRLNDVLSDSIDWVEENLEVIRFRKVDEARHG